MGAAFHFRMGSLASKAHGGCEGPWPHREIPYSQAGLLTGRRQLDAYPALILPSENLVFSSCKLKASQLRAQARLAAHF
jgi:hypothetical protein